MSTSGFLSSSILGVILSFGIIYFSPQLIKQLSPTNDSENIELQEDKLENPKEKELSKQEKKLGSLLGVSHNVLSKTLKEEFVVRKSKKLQKVLGITESDVREYVRNDDSEFENSVAEEFMIKKTRKLQKVLGMDEHDVREALRNLPEKPITSIDDSTSNSSPGSYSFKRDTNFSYEERVNWFKLLDGFILLILFAVFCFFFNHSTNGDFGRVIVGLFPREFEALGLKEILERMSPNDPRMAEGIAARLK